jgi:hypothetical protein
VLAGLVEETALPEPVAADIASLGLARFAGADAVNLDR